MSLKAVHLCFISLSLLLALGFGFWGVRDYALTRNLVRLALGIGAFLGGVFLGGYLVWFVGRMKRIPPS